jgi:hypothetical protein
LFLLKKNLWIFFYKKIIYNFFFNASPPARFLEKIERGGMLCSGGPKFGILGAYKPLLATRGARSVKSTHCSPKILLYWCLYDIHAAREVQTDKAMKVQSYKDDKNKHPACLRAQTVRILVGIL